MIEDLKPYPQYKDSGLAWLGKVPAHWGIARSKRLFRQRKEFAQSDDQQLSATQAFGVIPQALYEQRTGYRVVKISMHLNKRKHVQADDFVISMRSFQGGLERAWAAGAIRSSYVVLEPGAEVSAGYFQHLFKSHQYINALRATSDFIRDGQDLNFGNFCGVDLPLIPLQEQAAIARFLAWATNRLDRAIRAKRRIIALLQEQKQAIIHRAVTRGLDPFVPLKDSGIPWLGEIPVHWECRRFKFVARINSGQVDPNKSPFMELALIAPNHIQSGSGRIIKLETAAVQGARSGKYFARKGQILYSKIRPSLRKATIAPCDCLCSADMYAIAPRANLLTSGYLHLLMLSHIFTKFAVDASMRVAMPKVNRAALADCILWYPKPEEQKLIHDSIEKRTAPFDSSIYHIEREVTLLREYRTRLIADVVTGKLDVREVAAGLPEEELQDQSDVEAVYDADEAEDDAQSDLIDTAED
jgi:type I restriction enzyme S subunit